jgi:hypothetical protein
MRGLSTGQRGVRIDFAGNGNQRLFEDDDHSSQGRFLARECGKISQIPRLKTEVFDSRCPAMTQGANGWKVLPSAGFRYLVCDPFRGSIIGRPIQSLLSQRTGKSGCLSPCKRAKAS